MNIEELKEILALFEKADITELELEREGVRIRLKKGASFAPVGTPAPRVRMDAPAAARTEERAEEAEGLVQIESPMVGTFYSAPAPDADPFVEEGDQITEGQVVCIIEAMKLMNEIKAERAGRVVKVLLENGQPVEFGQPLFLIRPA